MNDLKDRVYYRTSQVNGEVTTTFDDEIALAYLLMQGIVIVNDYSYYTKWPKDAQDSISLSVCCNDIFYHGADGERVTYDDLRSLFDHVTKDEMWGSTMWCIKKRRMQPLTRIYQDLINHPVWHDEIENLIRNFNGNYGTVGRKV